MGKYVMLEIDDEQCAQELIANPPQGTKVIGSFMKPTLFCACTDILIKDGLVKPGQFVRGAKYGLYIHRKCNKPYAGHTHYPKNLLLDVKPREGQGLTVTMNHPYTPYKRFGGAK